MVTMTSPETPAANATPALDYHAQADAVLSALEARIDAWLQDDVIDIDCHRTGGVLELAFPNGSKIIVNKQPPLEELWLAAKAGGYHYRWVQGQWLDSRDGSEFFAVLSRNASAQAGRALAFEPA
jgi:CyaY protein